MTKRISWSLVDLTRPAAELAEELGVNVQTIYRVRRKLGIAAPNLSGGKPGNKGGGAREGAGRPKLEESEKIKMTYVRMLPSELEALKAIAKRKRMTYSELVRLTLQKLIREENQTNGQAPLDQRET